MEKQRLVVPILWDCALCVCAACDPLVPASQTIISEHGKAEVQMQFWFKFQFPNSESWLIFLREACIWSFSLKVRTMKIVLNMWVQYQWFSCRIFNKICLKQSQNFLQSVVPYALLNSECVQCVQEIKIIHFRKLNLSETLSRYSPFHLI